MAESMPPELENTENLLLEDDYYALLNLCQNASPDEITSAYRTFCKLYHPDKYTDPAKKKNAEIIFNKIKRAYEVLNDPHQRAIYDTLGIRGLQTDGWQIVERTKTPQEIREEYQQLMKEKEERILQQRTNPKGNIIIQVNATDLFENYVYDPDYPLPAFEISSMSITQSVQAPMSTSDTLILNCSLQSQNGNGSGNISCSLKKVLSSKFWMETSVGAGNGLGFNWKCYRALQNHCFATIQTNFQFVNMGLSPGLEFMLGRQLAKKTAGYITWKTGASSSVNTTFVRDTEKGHFVSSIQLNPKLGLISMSYIHTLQDEGKLRGSIKFGMFGVICEYGCEKKITKLSRLGAAMVVGTPSGVTLKLKITRAEQSFIFPILLSDKFLPSAVFYGTIVCVVGWFVLKHCVINPYNKKEKQRQHEKSKEANAQKLAELRKEASIAVSLMQEKYKRIKETEENRNGLVIKLAVYGSVESISNLNVEQLDSNLDVIDCTVQLQCFVKDSRLILPDKSKSKLSGFYDPCLGEEKSLYIEYSYRNVVHSITIKDDEILRLPIAGDV